LFQNSGTNFVTGTNITSNFAGVMVRSAWWIYTKKLYLFIHN
jgi:hypothetical protein